MRKLLPVFGLLLSFFVNAQTPLQTYFEKTKGLESPVYADIIAWWQQLDAQSGKVKLLTMGPSDAGFPLHLAVVSNNGDYNFTSIHKNNKRVILINNGIHPG